MSNTRSMVHGACLLPASGLRAATSRFSRTVRLLKMRRPCGTSATPRAAIASGGTAGDVVAEHRRPRRARGGSKPTATFMQVDLAGAVAAEQPEQAAFAERERDAMQHMAVAVEGVDVARALSASVAKVDLPGARIGDHLGARALDDDLAEMQDA